MIRRSVVILAALVVGLCLGFTLSGCPKKTVIKEEPVVKSEEASRAEAERETREKAEREALEKAEREAREKVQREAREKEEAAKREQEKSRELEKSLVAKKQPGIEGEVFESRLLKDVHFDLDKYDIRPEDEAMLKDDAALLARYSGGKIQIEGHCDERGTAEYNLALGERRASSVKKALVSLGIPANRMSTISYGKEMPLDPGHDEEAWAKNRRAHIVILK